LITTAGANSRRDVSINLHDAAVKMGLLLQAQILNISWQRS